MKYTPKQAEECVHMIVKMASMLPDSAQDALMNRVAVEQINNLAWNINQLNK